MVKAIREMSAGRQYLSRGLSDRALDAYAEKAKATVTDAYDALTSREREVLQLAAESSNTSEIAARLGISPCTVETPRENLIRKLGLKSQTDLIRYALRRGIMPLDE